MHLFDVKTMKRILGHFKPISWKRQDIIIFFQFIHKVLTDTSIRTEMVIY